MAASPYCLQCPAHAGRTGIDNLRWLPVAALVPLVYDRPQPVETERRIDVGDDRRNRAFDVRSNPWLVNQTVKLVRLVKQGFLLVDPAIRTSLSLRRLLPFSLANGDRGANCGGNPRIREGDDCEDDQPNVDVSAYELPCVDGQHQK